MSSSTRNAELSYAQRLEILRARKQDYTREKQQIRGAMDFDDHGQILPPEDTRELVSSVSGSGVAMTDVLMNTFKPKANHPSGGFFGPRACGENFRALLEVHPVFIDPLGSLAGAYMVNFMSYRTVAWKPELDYSHLEPEHQKYQILHAIGGVQHFCQDMAIGLRLGWGGLLEKIARGREANGAADFYAGLEYVVRGLQDWIARHAAAARRMAADDGDSAANLLEIARINEHLVSAPPRTFRESCQWILWHLLAARMYNGSGALGRLDVLLQPYYDADIRAGRLADEEAVFHVANLLLRDSAYFQLGGPDAAGKDLTSGLSLLILEAAHRLRIPANVGVSVGKKVDSRLLRRGVEILLEDRTGVPKFLGVDNTVAGFVRAGFPPELARERVYAGCHWVAIPGREYALMDIIKLNFAAILDVALREMVHRDCPNFRGHRAQHGRENGTVPFQRRDPLHVENLWDGFVAHLRRAVAVVAEGIDFHFEHMHEVFPELVLDLLAHGPLEKGLDASHGGVEHYTFGVDGMALANAADSLAAIEARVEQEQRLTWRELLAHLDADWAVPAGEGAVPIFVAGRQKNGTVPFGGPGERLRRMMLGVPRFGSGGSRADHWAVRIVRAFADAVVAKPTPGGRRMIPGLFSWALSIPLGKRLGATADGRRAGSPLAHGANPSNGFRRDGAPTALAAAVAAVQPGYGNTAPLQLDLDPGFSGDCPNFRVSENGTVPISAVTADDVRNVAALIRGHFDLGGTQVNINILDRERLRQAQKNPALYPDLIVRVTGFSAYFASLSPEFRQMVIDRVLGDG
jgi:formate C-acetyltransferase